MNYLLILIPILNALFAWWIIDSLLLFVFRPFDTVKIFGLSIQGILPSLQNEIAQKAAVWVEQNISPEKMETFLLSEKNLNEMNKFLEIKADDFIRNKLTERIPLLNMFITEGIIVQAKTVLIEQLRDMIPELIKNIAPKVSENMQIGKMVQTKINNYPLQQLEMEMKRQAKAKLLFMKIIFCLAGFLLGLIEIALIIS